MQEVVIKDEFIKLGQALKLAGLTDSGVDAKLAVQNGLVFVNGTICTMRGKKLVDGDSVEYEGESFVIKSEKKE
jgi:ribosome-associated protein